MLGQCGAIPPRRTAQRTPSLLTPSSLAHHRFTTTPTTRVLHSSCPLSFAFFFCSANTIYTYFKKSPIPKADTMAPRRAATRGGISTPSARRRAPAGVRKNTSSRQAPNRLGQQAEPPRVTPVTEDAIEPSSGSEEPEPSIPEYSHSPTRDSQIHRAYSQLSNTISPPRVTPASPSEIDSHTLSRSPSDMPINLGTRRELLRSHEQEIIDRVVLQLSSRNQHPPIPSPVHTQVPPSPIQGTQPTQNNSTLTKVTELERQLAQLRRDSEQDLVANREPRALGMYDPSQPLIPEGSESALGIAESVERLFPGVERTTLVHIIENRFKQTNIYRLLASEQERAESQRTICIGGVEFQQAERDGKENEYRMSNFFKAWAAYSGILVKLAPYPIQGDLATSLSIYTMNLYDLLEKYAWDRVKAYHFQFHRKRVASGKNIYLGTEWRLLDSELIASKCFAHPVQRALWTQSTKPAPAPTRRTQELAIRDNIPRQAYNSTGTNTPLVHSQPQHHRTNTGSTLTPMQPCRNWNYRECRNSQCCYHHTCITCGSNHRASQCPSGNGVSFPSASQGPRR